MREIILTDAADQEFTTILNDLRCTFRFRWNVLGGFWTFDLWVREELVLLGRKVVLGVDLVAPFNFGIGAIFAVDYEGKGLLPDRTSVPERRVRIFHADPEEIEAVRNEP